MTEKIKGRIIKGLGGLYDILTEDSSVLSCRARGVFRHNDTTPTVGDCVVLRADSEGTFIESIEERKNLLIRPPLSNVDVMFIMAASNQTMADTDSQVKERFEAGNLTYTDKDGNAVNAVYYNTGNVFKALAKYYESVGDTQNSLNYTAAFNSWLSKNHSGASDIDDWGFEIVNEK